MHSLPESITANGDHANVPFIEIFSVESGFQLKESVATDDIAGLLCFQVAAMNRGPDILYVLWLNEEFQKAGERVFRKRLESSGQVATPQCSGHQRQARVNKIKAPLYKTVFSWTFVVQVAATWGVLLTLASYFNSFSDWALVTPRTYAIDSGKIIPLLERQEKSHAFSFCIDSRGGTTDLKIDKIYLNSAATPVRRYDAAIDRDIGWFRSLKPGAVVEVKAVLPRLPSGSYQIVADISHQSGWIHKLRSGGRCSLSIGCADVAPYMTAYPPYIQHFPSASIESNTTRFAVLEFKPGLSCPGIAGSVALKWPEVQIKSVIGAIPESVQEMTFAPGSQDESGLSWRTGPVRALDTISLLVQLEGPPSYTETQWNNVAKQLYIPLPGFVAGP